MNGHATHDDPFNLQRFIAAQEPVYGEALQELHRGEKRGHWMWFIFPQLKGLGVSATAEYYGLAGIREAAAYLGHTVLGARLKECVSELLILNGRTAEQIFPYPDYLKFRSSMTLFEQVSGHSEFSAALAKYFGGEVDLETIRLLAAMEPNP